MTTRDWFTEEFYAMKERGLYYWFRTRITGWDGNEAYPRWRRFVCKVWLALFQRHFRYDSWYGPHTMGSLSCGPNEGMRCTCCGESWRI